LTILLDDEERAGEMGEAGRRFVEDNFTWDRVVARFQAGFDAVAS
jgi:glycosyltransferase involved in cell wall biosynthesis